MRYRFCLHLALVAGLFSVTLEAADPKPARISVGYFLQWPTPGQFSQAKKTYDSVLGLEVDWVPFASGSEMNAALADDRIQIAYAHGHVPFLVGVSNGLDLTMVGIAVGYSANDNCILRRDAGFRRAQIEQLEGRKVATPAGGVTHFRLLEMLRHLGVDASRVEIVATDGPDAAAEALRNGEVVMACAYGNALRGMLDLGEPLMSATELEVIGLKVFDTITVATDFMNRYPEIVQAFMDVTEASNAQWRENSALMEAAIAKAAQMDQRSASETLARFSFPSAEEQKSSAWMGELVPEYTRRMAEFFVAQGRLGKSLDNYNRFITTRFLR